jgi:hypothetical protein
MKSLSNWANEHQALFTSAVALFCLIAGLFANRLFNGPTFFPTAVVLTDEDERPVERADLSDEASACDSAVRSMLLAFADEADELGSRAPGFSDRASAAVESPFAIIPEECRSQIDEGFVISADGVRASLRTARQVGNKVEVSFVLTNALKSRRRFAIKKFDSAEVKVSSGAVSSIKVSGISKCSLFCDDYDYWSATQIDGGRSLLVHIEALLTSDEQASTTTVIIPIFRWSDRYGSREVVLAFNDIPLTHVTEPDAFQSQNGLDAEQ